VQFYFGEWNVLRGDKACPAEGRRNLPEGFIEHAGAVAELKRLNR